MENSKPKIFSVLSLSSKPPIHISEPLSSLIKKSLLLALWLPPTSFKTFGRVSFQTDCLTALNLCLNIICLLSGAPHARLTIAYIKANVLPDLEPPKPRVYFALFESRVISSDCLEVRVTISQHPVLSLLLWL